MHLNVMNQSHLIYSWNGRDPLLRNAFPAAHQQGIARRAAAPGNGASRCRHSRRHLTGSRRAARERQAGDARGDAGVSVEGTGHGVGLLAALDADP